MDIKMETNELFTKDTCLYKKNGRYKNLLKAFNLYTDSIITDEGVVINKTFIDRITELNKNLMANMTVADLLRFVCFKPKPKCYRKSFIEYYNEIAKMYNAIDDLSKEPVYLSVLKENGNE